MTDIKHFPTTASTSPEIDVHAMSQAVKDISRLSQQQDALVIEAIREKSQRIASASSAADTGFRNALPGLQAAVGHIMSDASFESIAELDAALADPGLDEADRDILLEERAAAVDELGVSIRALITSFRTETENLSAGVTALRNIVLEERVVGLIEEKETAIEDQLSLIKNKQEEKDKYEEDRDKIIESQNLIRGKNIIDTYNDYIPSGEELEGLDLSSPEKEIVKQSVDIAKKMLGNMSDGLKYSQLAEARKDLDRKIDGKLEEIQTLQDELKSIEATIVALNKAVQVSRDRDVQATQLEKITQAWGGFCAQLVNLGGQSVSEQQLTTPMRVQKAFLDGLANQLARVIVV